MSASTVGRTFFCHTKFLHCPYAAMIRFWGAPSRFNTPVTIFACFCNMKRVFYSLQETESFSLYPLLSYEGAGCWKQTPGLLFSEEKVTAREGGGCFVWAKDRWTLRAAETQKERTSYRCPSFWKGRLKLIFPLNETAAQRCELALTYKKSEQAIQSLLRSWSRVRESNPPSSAWEADALPMY